MPGDIVAGVALLPEMEFIKQRRGPRGGVDIYVKMTSPMEVCPRCAAPCRAVYDRRWVTIRDAPLHGVDKRFIILKRRFSCWRCRKPFTEPVPGIIKGKRTTERRGREVKAACEDFVSLKKVRKFFRCSGGYIYASLYQHLERKQRELRTDWPEKVGLDEHLFKRIKGPQKAQFVTMVVDQTNGRLMEVVEGKRGEDLYDGLHRFSGRENVRWVSIDLCDPYKKFVQEFFPNANIVADKFHVLRLLSGPLMKYRKEAEGGKNTRLLRNLLLCGQHDVPHQLRPALHQWLAQHPELNAIYTAKEKLGAFYRCRSVTQAARYLTSITDSLAITPVPELQRLRRTLRKWRSAILNYWSCRLTNARVEAFNNIAKLIKRRAFGYISFRNYRLRLLNACGG